MNPELCLLLTLQCHPALGQAFWGDLFEYDEESGYVNRNALEKTIDSEWKDYSGGAKNAARLQELQDTLGAEIIIPGRRIKGVPGNRCTPTLIHPEAAMLFAAWRRPQIAVKITGLVQAYLSGSLTAQQSQEAVQAEVRGLQTNPCSVL